MPELPEVENIKLQLEKFLVGHRIVKVDINYDKTFEGEKDNILNAIKSVRRFAKVLVVDLVNDYSIVIQIKLTGQLIYKGPNLEEKPISKKVIGGVPGKHTHVVFYLDRGGVLYYNDVRKFGRIRVVKTPDVETSGLVGRLGPEPNITESSAWNLLTLDKFRKIANDTSQPVKMLLMDQTKLSGIGNIYANDALWLAEINPKKKADKLGVGKIRNLFKAIIDVLGEGIKKGGASELSYVTPDGGEGEYQNYSHVYGRAGEKCKRCGCIIEKFKMAGRGTYFCPKCQV